MPWVRHGHSAACLVGELAKLKRRNKNERETAAQATLFDTVELDVTTAAFTKRLNDIESQPDASLTHVRARADAWRRFAEDPELKSAKLLADAWCAAFVQPKGAHHGQGITHRIVQQLQDDPKMIAPAVTEQISALAREFRFFHWHLEFPGSSASLMRAQQVSIR